MKRIFVVGLLFKNGINFYNFVSVFWAQSYLKGIEGAWGGGGAREVFS